MPQTWPAEARTSSAGVAAIHSSPYRRSNCTSGQGVTRYETPQCDHVSARGTTIFIRREERGEREARFMRKYYPAGWVIACPSGKNPAFTGVNGGNGAP